MGYIGAALILASFAMRSMRPLRWLAIASNVAMIGYGVAEGLMPVMLLHMALLPVNIFRLGVEPPREPDRQS